MSHQSEEGSTQWRKMARLWQFIRPHWAWLLLGISHHAVERVSTQIAAPFLLQQMTDAVSQNGLSSMPRWLMVGAGLLILDATFALVGTRALARYIAYTVRDIRSRVTAHLQQLPMAFLTDQRTGDLVSRLNADVGKIETWLPTVRELAVQPLVFIFGVIYMLTISWKLLLASSILIPVSALLYNRVSRPMEALARAQSEGEGRTNAALHDMLAGIVTVKAYNLQGILGSKFHAIAKNVEHQALRLDWRRAVFIAVYLALRYIPQLIVPLYGGRLAFRGEISIGELLAANLVIWMVFLPIEQLLNFVGGTRETIPAVERVTDLLEVLPEATGGDRFVRQPERPAISLRGVDFGYEGHPPLLEQISFDVRHGDTVALVGASGCGKSTLLKLLCGFYTPQRGTIRIYGNQLGETDLAAIRQRIALMGQETYLFPTTIAENIALGRPGTTMAEIITAAQAAHAHDFILSQPDGYQTHVGERGARLSGGERQRIGLARAILRDAPILLLDEPTSSLDTQSEALIRQAMENVIATRTVLIVAHRLTTLQQADRVLVLDTPSEADIASTICEVGTHEELMAADTRYRRLYLRQLATQGVPL